MEFKPQLQKLNIILNSTLTENRLLNEDELREMTLTEKYISKLNVEITLLGSKLEALNDIEKSIHSQRRMAEFNNDPLMFEVKTAVRMAFVYAVRLPEDEFFSNFYGSMSGLGKHFTATEEQLLKSQTLQFGDHYEYLYTFIKK